MKLKEIKDKKILIILYILYLLLKKYEEYQKSENNYSHNIMDWDNDFDMWKIKWLIFLTLLKNKELYELFWFLKSPIIWAMLNNENYYIIDFIKTNFIKWYTLSLNLFKADMDYLNSELWLSLYNTIKWIIDEVYYIYKYDSYYISCAIKNYLGKESYNNLTFENIKFNENRMWYNFHYGNLNFY